MKKLEISIIIPSYNGKNLLEKHLPSIVKASKKHKDVMEIIVVDDGSTDNTISFLKRAYPDIKTVLLKNNQGFINAANSGVQKSKSRLILLLNNDIKVDINFIEPLVRHFYKHKNLFAVTSKSLINYLGKKNTIESISKGIWQNGMFVIEQPCLKNPNYSIKSTSTNFHASGGFSVFDRIKFLSLGGFDNLYYPFYLEDVDISYRAWKEGWKIFYEPESIVYHKYHSTISQVMKKEDIYRIYHKNNLLFIWKNIVDKKLLRKHIEYLKSKLMDYKETSMKISIYNAFKQINDIIMKKNQKKYKYKISDKDIIKISSNIPI